MYSYSDVDLDGTNSVDYYDSENEYVTQPLKAPSESFTLRSTCPSSITSAKQDLCERDLPESVNDFFQTKQMGCFPEEAGMDRKAQPWRAIRREPQSPSADGKLMIACPKNCVWGSGSGLGGY